MKPRYQIDPAVWKNWLFGLGKNALILASTLILVFKIDLIAPSEISTFPLYLIPIGLATSLSGSRAGYLSCLLSCIAWFSAYLLQGNSVGLLFGIQAMFARGLVFFLINYLLIQNRNYYRSVSDRMERLKSILPICPDCGKLLCYDGKWRNVGDVLNSEFFIAMPTHNCQIICANLNDDNDHPTCSTHLPGEVV